MRLPRVRGAPPRGHQQHREAFPTVPRVGQAAPARVSRARQARRVARHAGDADVRVAAGQPRRTRGYAARRQVVGQRADRVREHVRGADGAGAGGR